MRMQSMTGYGRWQEQRGEWEATVELRAVNHRYLDVAMRLPRSLSFLEETLRKGIAAGLKRGHVEVFLTVKRTGESARQVTVDEALAAAYDRAAERIAQAVGRPSDVTVAKLLTLPGVTEVTEAELEEDAALRLCAQVVAETVAQVNAMRDREGEALRCDLTAHLDQAAAIREKILARAPRVVEEYRQRLEARLAQLQLEQVDPARLAQEVAIMADRCAVDEELSRLESHIAQMRGYMTRSGEVGKKMDFLVQEMNREANTIGSKANDAAIAQMVVDLKSEVEKLREQIQNVE